MPKNPPPRRYHPRFRQAPGVKAPCGRTRSRHGLFRAVLLALAGSLGITAFVQAEDGLPALIWPLCGRLGEAPGQWQPGQPCPQRDAEPAVNDLPIHNGYGLRNFVDDSRPVSFHRGIDLATRAATAVNGLIGNPVFAACAGYVFRITGTEPDATLELKCPLAGGVVAADSCGPDNPCITAAYRHVQAFRIAPGSVVARGDHLAFTGSTAPNGVVFEHLHFEVLDPRLRPSSSDGGRTAFSKDAQNPLRYLPRPANPGASPTVAVSLGDADAFNGYNGSGAALVLRFDAQPGFLFDFEAVSVEVFAPQGDRWQRRGKDVEVIEAETGSPSLIEYSDTLAAGYPLADGDLFVSRHAAETQSRFYSPYSEGSSLWAAERLLSWYRLLHAGQHPGLDGLLERNASGRLAAGHLVQDFDFRLIRPNPNPDQSIEAPLDPASWWGMTLGLREFGPILAPPYCLRVTLNSLPDQGSGRARFTETWLPVPTELDCQAARDSLRIFRSGFESGES